MEIDKIFDTVLKSGSFIMLQDKKTRKVKQLESVQAKKCGNCYHWMKSSCKPEKEQGQFKSCNSLPCEDFSLSDFGGLILRFQRELVDINKEIKSLNSV